MGALVARTIRENTDESIVCVCYTNHALDQFLEHMLDAGETRLVRMGGRSKSERLAPYQLRDLARAKSRDASFCQKRIKQVHAHLFKLKEQIEDAVRVLKTPLSWDEPSGGVHGFLTDEEPWILEFLTLLNADDRGGFNLVGPRGRKLGKDMLWNCWQRGERFPEWLLPHVRTNRPAEFDAFWGLPLNERADLIEVWRQNILEPINNELSYFIEIFNLDAKEDQSLCRESELAILNNARIIGATTAGAAAYRDLLASKAAGVVLVEEAGEVLESHVLTSLAGGNVTGSTKHLILIGDHKQLPPKVENYELTTTSGSGYDLDCSLFERLVHAGKAAVTLEVQHRMRPSISALIRAQTYPSLRDHDSVTKYPEVKGVSESLLFIDHGVPEDGAEMENATTKSNAFEADLCVEIVRFLLLQGYRTDQIVVLTPYLGQLLTIMAKMKTIRDVETLVSDRDMEDLDELDPECENLPSSVSNREDKKGIRCSSIDNYQGEEADIVVISCKFYDAHFDEFSCMLAS
jgi:AAA domain